MTFRSRTRAAIAGFVAVGAVLFGAALPAQAVPWRGCDTGYTCVWQHKDYEGAWGKVFSNNATWEWNMSDPVLFASNRVSSLGTGSLSSCLVRVYKDEDFEGDYIYFYEAGTPNKISRDPYLFNGGGHGTTNTREWNDDIESNMYRTC